MTLDIKTLQDATILDQDGGKIGTVGQVYVDDRTEQPTFATVSTGLFGSKESFVPLHNAAQDNDGVRVPYTKDYVKDAPQIEADGHLDERQQDDIYRYYQLDQVTQAGRSGQQGSEGDAEAGTRQSGTDTGTVGRGGPNGDRADASGDRAEASAGQHGEVGGGDAVTLREEQLNVSKERVQSGRVRIRKYVVTEQQTVTVPVEREEFEVVREPITDGATGGRLGEENVEVTLSEERPVVEKQVVDKERVGLQTRSVTEEKQVQAEVGHEEFSVERDGEDTPKR